TVLGLHQTQVTANSLPVLASMPRLAGLVVSCTGIVGDELPAVRRCAELRLLAVHASQLTEPVHSRLSTFPNLTHLTVLSSTSGPDAGLAQEAFGSGTHVVMDDPLLQRILKETTITTVWIEDGSGITDPSVPALLKAGHIHRLDVWDVGMSAEG